MVIFSLPLIKISRNRENLIITRIALDGGIPKILIPKTFFFPYQTISDYLSGDPRPKCFCQVFFKPSYEMFYRKIAVQQNFQE
jgi:hypothetical protein